MTAGPTIHASAVAVGGNGVLVRGASGSGKSSLILRLMALAPDTTALVADDRVHLAADQGRLVATVPPAIAGKLEVRGVGIVTRAYVSPVAITLVVDLLPLADCPRLPTDRDAVATIEGVTVRRIALPIGQSDAAERVQAALMASGDR